VYWCWITLVYCGYLTTHAILRPEFRKARRPLVWATVVAGLITTTPTRTATSAAFMAVVPSIVLLAGYRLSGLLFVHIDSAVENALEAMDRSWLHRPGLIRWYAGAPRLAREYFEASYLLVYAALPAGAVVLIAIHQSSWLERYWSVVILSEFICYGTLPWIQTRPPMLREDERASLPSAVGVRRLNQQIARRASIHANTIPSGHAAGAMAAALVLMSVTPVGFVFFVLAMSIAIASVLGRYHYALDSLLGIAVALLAWIIV